MRNITTARVEYRENTSGNGIFIPDFSGNSAQYYLQKWRMIELERDEKYESMIENNKVVLSKIEEKIEAVREELNSYQKTRLWKTKDRKSVV